MTRFQARISIWKHRLLCHVSKAYRDLDAIMSDREKWRRDAVKADMALAARISELAELKDRLKSALEAQESATAQLIAERALRQSAQEQADRYHHELTDSLKSAANMAAQVAFRRPMFGDAAMEPESQEPSNRPSIHQKRMARSVVSEVTNTTLKNLLDEIRAGNIPDEQPIGPEFSTQ